MSLSILYAEASKIKKSKRVFIKILIEDTHTHTHTFSLLSLSLFAV